MKALEMEKTAQLSIVKVKEAGRKDFGESKELFLIERETELEKDVLKGDD